MIPKLSTYVALVDDDILYNQFSKGFGPCKWCGTMTMRLYTQGIECVRCKKCREYIRKFKQRNHYKR